MGVELPFCGLKFPCDISDKYLERYEGEARVSISCKKGSLFSRRLENSHLHNDSLTFSIVNKSLHR